MCTLAVTPLMRTHTHIDNKNRQQIQPNSSYVPPIDVLPKWDIWGCTTFQNSVFRACGIATDRDQMTHVADPQLAATEPVSLARLYIGHCQSIAQWEWSWQYKHDFECMRTETDELLKLGVENCTFSFVKLNTWLNKLASLWLSNLPEFSDRSMTRDPLY